MNYRQDRINEGVAKALNEILPSIKDPRVSGSFVTINFADVSKDLKYAKIYFGCISGDPAEIKKGLDNAKGFLRSRLAETLNLRITPQLTFYYDSSAKRGADISRILKSLDLKDDEEI